MTVIGIVVSVKLFVLQVHLSFRFSSTSFLIQVNRLRLSIKQNLCTVIKVSDEKVKYKLLNNIAISGYNIEKPNTD